jgi:hypothetical protein
MKFRWRYRKAEHAAALRAFAFLKCGRMKEEEAAVIAAVHHKESGEYRFCENPELITEAQLEDVRKLLKGMQERSRKWREVDQKRWEAQYGRRKYPC